METLFKNIIKNEIIYSLNISDLQTVAHDYLNRNLTEDEIQKIIKKLPDYINWYEAIGNALYSEVINKNSH